MFLETRNNFSTCIHGIMSIDAQKLYTSVKKRISYQPNCYKTYYYIDSVFIAVNSSIVRKNNDFFHQKRSKLAIEIRPSKI